MSAVPPPFDSELERHLAELRSSGAAAVGVSAQEIAELRAFDPEWPMDYQAAGSLVHEEYDVESLDGTKVVVSVIRSSRASSGPGIFYIHGGG